MRIPGVEGSFVLLVALLVVNCVAGADPCFDTPGPEPGSSGNCVPENVCDGEVSDVADACPSFPQGYVCCFSDNFPGREVRGAWIATVDNIDWPKSPADSVARQQMDLRHLIDKLELAGINTIYFQVRPAGDALYVSDIEPWSKYLTGTQGVGPSPAWDPLQFVIDYAGEKNMDVHAWINPYRASLSPNSNGLAANHMAVLFPQYAYPFSTYLWMDPGAEVVQNRTLSVVVDLATRYDLAGIHMDDYFYPYPVSGVSFPDGETFAGRENQSMGLADWRRDNVNKLIRAMNTAIHQVKPWLVFSISPFGIYRPCEAEGMPCTITGFDQYSEIYCDAKLWLEQGWIDVLQPQLYWKISAPGQPYRVLLQWWTDHNYQKRHVYAGNYLSRVINDGWTLDELTDQVKISRESQYRFNGSWGNIQFSAKVFDGDLDGAIDHFSSTVYSQPALQPSFPWLVPRDRKDERVKTPFVNLMDDEVVISPADSSTHKVVLFKREEGNEWRIHSVKTNGKGLRQRLSPGSYAVMGVDRYGRPSSKKHFNV